MLTNRWLTFSAVIITHIAVPLLLLGWLVLMPSSSWIEGILKYCLVLFAMIWLSLAGYWTILGYYFRYLWPSLAVFAGVIAIPALKSQPIWFAATPINWLSILSQTVIFVGLIYQLFSVIKSYFYPTAPMTIALPLRGGTYGISFGGNGKASSIMNYHYKYSSHTASGTQPAMAFAVDIVKLQGWGMSRNWVLPANNEDFAIYQEAVISPCNGQIVYVENNWADQTPFSLNRPYNPGNHVILRTGDIEILLGHLQKDSITVHFGDQVQIGQVLGCIGNSGFSDWPHLHIQATRVTSGTIWEGEGIPILFDGRNSIKNALFTRQGAKS